MASQSSANASTMPEGVTDTSYRPSPGHLGNLTADQEKVLDQFRTILKDEGVFVEERMDDATLLRFLRARKFDLPKALEMIKSCENWRKDFGVDDIVKNFDFKEKEQVDKYYPQYYHKMDKDGRPIYIEHLGKLDMKELAKITTPERQLQRLVLEYEIFLRDRLPACSKVVGHPVETSCTILDLKNVSLSGFYQVKNYLSSATSIGQDRYPETMGKFYVVNAPWAFSAVWSIIKNWLDPVTVDKISILSSTAYQKEVLKQISSENLPVELGGSCSCEGGCSLSDAGPWNEIENKTDTEAKETA